VSIRVAYVAYTFPALTQTFTTREVLALRECGVDVVVFASRADPAADLDSLAERARGLTRYLPAALSGPALLALLRWCGTRPMRTCRTFLQCLGGGYRDRPWLSRLRAVRHFVVGAALASALRSRPGVQRIHAQFVDAGSTVAFVASRLTDIPFSFTNHTAYNPFLLRPKSRHADRVVSISDFDRDRTVEQAPEARGKTFVCRVGIDTRSWSDLERRPEPGRLLCVAALRAKKGQLELVQAAAELLRRGRDVTVVLAGDGEERERVARCAAEAGVDVELLGAVGPDRVREELTRAGAFVLPCRVAPNGDLDGIPVAIMEAMAAGVPVVSTRLSGVPELVVDGESGYLAAPGDVPTLVEALERCLDAGAEQASLCERARERVRSMHEISLTSDRLARVLRGEAVNP
jgi:glycosyltransferase involved in cell wall biosynthesis